MKKFSVLFVLTMVIIGTVSAQGWCWNNSGQGGNPPPQITVTGTLQLQNGTIAITSGTTTYLVPQLMRYTGFINGLQAGANVTIAGFECGGNVLHPLNLTIGGTSYDLQGMAGGNHGGRGGGWGGGHRGGGGGGWGCPRWVN